MKKVFRYIDENREKYIDWLIEICKQPSVSAQNRGMMEMACLVEEALEFVGAEHKRVPTSGHPVVYGMIDRSKEKTLSFYNHYDVQPEDPLELWESDPFKPEIRDGRLFARGVADNKGTFLARICAIHAYQQVYGELPINIKFIVEGEEEIGSPHLAEFADNHPEKVQADGCVWENGMMTNAGNLHITLGVKGMLYVELRAKGANMDIHSMNAAIIENPAWRLVWALSTLKNDKEEVLIEGFYDNIAEPTPKEKELLENLQFNEDDMLEQFDLDSYLLNLTGLPLKEKLYLQPTCTICGIESGYTGEGSKTVLPNTAKAKLDFRLVDGQDPHKILELLKKHLDVHGFSDIEIVPLTPVYPSKTDLDDPLVKTVIENVERVYDAPPYVMRSTPGTGPMYELSQKFGIPAVGFGVGNEQSQVHAPNENIRVKDYIDGIKFAAAVIDEFGK